MTLPRCGISVGGRSLNRDNTTRAAELADIVAAGAALVRHDCPKGNETRAKSYALEVVAAGMVPMMILGGSQNAGHWLSDADFASWCATQAAANPAVTLFEILNEPNGTFAGYTATTYAGRVNAAYPAIKLVRPDATVFVGATAIGSSARDAFNNFTTPLIPLISASLDVFSIHAADDITVHAWWQGAAWAWGPVDGVEITGCIRDLLDGEGRTDVPIAISEFDQQGATEVTNALVDTRTPLTAVYTIWDDDVAGYGMVALDGTRLPSFYAFQAAAAPTTTPPPTPPPTGHGHGHGPKPKGATLGILEPDVRRRSGVGYLPTYLETYTLVIPPEPGSPTYGRLEMFAGIRGFVSTDFHVKQGDTSPPVRERLYNSDGTELQLPEGTVVRFHLGRRNGAVIVDAEATIEDEDGLVSYQWVDGDTDLSGTFYREWEVTQIDDTIVTVPDKGPGYLVIVAPQVA